MGHLDKFGFSPRLPLPCHHQTSAPVKGVSGADNPDLLLILSVGRVTGPPRGATVLFIPGT